MRLEEVYNKIIKEMQDILKSSGLKSTVLFEGYLGRNMTSQGMTEAYRSGESDSVFGAAGWSPYKELRVGAKSPLLKSFRYKDENSDTRIKIGSANVKVKFGSRLPYAHVHEHGEFIKSKGKMHKWFWYMYWKSKYSNDFYKIMALHVLKKGGVKIPKRPYFYPAFDDMEGEGYKILLQDAFEKIARVWYGHG